MFVVWIAAVKSATMRASIGQVGVVVLARVHLRITRGLRDSLAEVSPGFFSISNRISERHFNCDHRHRFSDPDLFIIHNYLSISFEYI